MTTSHEEVTTPAVAGMSDEEVIELRKQERGARTERSAREFTTRFVAGRD